MRKKLMAKITIMVFFMFVMFSIILLEEVYADSNNRAEFKYGDGVEKVDFVLKDYNVCEKRDVDMKKFYTNVSSKKKITEVNFVINKRKGCTSRSSFKNDKKTCYDLEKYVSDTRYDPWNPNCNFTIYTNMYINEEKVIQSGPEGYENEVVLAQGYNNTQQRNFWVVTINEKAKNSRNSTGYLKTDKNEYKIKATGAYKFKISEYK